MTIEQRQSTRSTVHVHIDIIDLANNEVLGTLINISEGGFMLRSEEEIPLNKLFQLKLAYESDQKQLIEIELGAESLWSNEISGPGNAWYGFHIIDISNRNLEEIQKLVNAWTN